MRTTGRDMQLTRQIGEHLVAAELGRRGYVATPFSGNVPMFDLLAADLRGRAVPIQVKAINGPSWQFSADTFLTVEIVDNEQMIRGKTLLPNPDLLCIFVLIKEAGKDEFYIFQLRDLQDHFVGSYKGGRRPKNPQSMHCAVWPKDLERFRNNWELVKTSLSA
jgi:hypothetical protein